MSEQSSAVAETMADEAIVQVKTPEADQEAVDEVKTPEGDKAEAKPEGDEDHREREETPAERRKRQREARERTEADLRDAKARLERIKKASQGAQEPKRDDFDDPDEYIAARAAWRSSEAFAQQQQAMAQAEIDEITAASAEAAKDAWRAQAEDARSKYPDFDQKVGNPNLPISEAMAAAITHSEIGGELAYHLASNPAEAFRISQLPPAVAGLEMGKIEVALTRPAPKTETKAPPPIETLEGSAQPSKDPLNMTPDQYRAWRQSGGKF